MIVINVSSLKAHLSEKLSKVREGETLVVTDRRTPIATILPYGGADEKLIERKAAGPFHPVRAARPKSPSINAAALLSTERGER
jgi:antitoxin (DNA-binding transcriptional repressor) of toxin-antitoxin stability system